MSTPNEVAPERVWWCDGDAFTLGAGGPCKLCVPYIRADTVTPNEVVEGLVEALRTIQDHEGKDADGGYVDEWSEAAAFAECQRLARAALSRYEATRKTRGGTDGGPG
jgi:hypothetical protein